MSTPLFAQVSMAARDLAAFLWPERCGGCGMAVEPHRILCADCHGAIPRLSLSICAKCLAAGETEPLCARHARHQVWPVWVYDERAARVIEAFKYSARTDLAPLLAGELAFATRSLERPDLVLSVPLHASRLRERGFNQSQLLAKALARQVGAPDLPGALQRVRATAAQARLGPAARRANVRGAFRVTDPGSLEGRRVWIVDDVLTTGATLEACLDVLSRAGAIAVATTLAWAQ